MCQSWNPGADRLFGYPAEHAIGQATSFLFEDGSDRQSAVRDRILPGETINGRETGWRRGDGTMGTASFVFFPLRAADGTITGTASIARDITEERRAERRLAESERRLRVALQTARMVPGTYNPVMAPSSSHRR